MTWQELVERSDLIGKHITFQHLHISTGIELVGTITKIKLNKRGDITIKIRDVFVWLAPPFEKKNKKGKKISILDKLKLRFNIGDTKELPQLIDDTIWVPTSYDNLIIFCVSS